MKCYAGDDMDDFEDYDGDTEQTDEDCQPKPAKVSAHVTQEVRNYYEDTEKHKPDPEPLLLVSKKLNTKPEEMVYIGDMESDLKAAHSAGMKAVLYNKKNLLNAEYWTPSFSKIPKIIVKL